MKNLKLEIEIALKYLTSKRKEGFASLVTILSFVGITLGVATLIVVMAVMHGVKTELVKRIIGINAHISIGSVNGDIKDYDALVKDIETISGVLSVFPTVHGQALAMVNGTNRGVMLRGLRAEDFNSKQILANSLRAGRLYDETDFNVIVGIQMVKQVGVNRDTKVGLISPNFNTTMFGSIPRMKEFSVSGIFDVGMYEYDSGVFFTSLKSAQKFFGKKDVVSFIEIEVSDPRYLDDIKKKLEAFVTDDMYLTDWQKANEGFIESINVQSNVLFLILMLIIIVAIFNVVSGMVILVSDKSREVAILRTIGMKARSVIRIFMVCGFSTSFFGTLLGLTIGLSFASNIDEIRIWLENLTSTNLFSAEIYFLSKLPAEVRILDVIKIVSLSMVLGLVSTIYPAYKAAKIEPAEALKV